jgi:MazG family protein
MTNQSASAAFEQLLTIMNELREKCPWDQKQTIHSLRTLTIEELYELGDAIIDEDWQGIKEELGDLFLHLVFYAKIGQEQNAFTLQEVLESINQKLINRHPHIYGDVKVKDEEDVKRNWEQLKLKEGKKSVLSGVPKGLPAVVKAIRIQEKSKKVGFEWDKKEDVFAKLQEEMGELQEAVADNDANHIEEEMGDVLFSLINYARFVGVDAETALEKTNQKFIYRFTQMEAKAKALGKDLTNMSLVEMDELWNEIKKQKNS